MASDTLVIPTKATLAKRLRLARQAAELEVAEVARAIGVSVSTWEKTEAGARIPRNGELIAFAQVTGQDPRLFGASFSEVEAPTIPLLPAAVNEQAGPGDS